jgi:hypothetical protein
MKKGFLWWPTNLVQFEQELTQALVTSICYDASLGK